MLLYRNLFFALDIIQALGFMQHTVYPNTGELSRVPTVNLDFYVCMLRLAAESIYTAGIKTPQNLKLKAMVKASR